MLMTGEDGGRSRTAVDGEVDRIYRERGPRGVPPDAEAQAEAARLSSLEARAGYPRWGAVPGNRGGAELRAADLNGAFLRNRPIHRRHASETTLAAGMARVQVVASSGPLKHPD